MKRMVDLFAGTGAFTHAFQSTGQVECVFANDMVEASKKIYDANFTHTLTLENLNDVKVEDIPAHDILTGGFPCFVEGTRVLTKSGYKVIEEVDDTDLLFTHTGSFQRILNKQIKHGCHTLHSIDIQYHPHTIQCTEEHPFYARFRYSKPEWIPANKLTNEHYTCLPISTECQEYQITDNIISPTIAYGIQQQCINKGILCSVTFISNKYIVSFNTESELAFIEDGYAWFKIKSNTSENTNPLTVYNFEVEHDNSYCVENTIVHNCQPFSIAGNQEGFNDERSNVFWKILAIIDHHGPRCVVLENVKNLVSHDEGNTFQIIKQNLEDRGYHVMTKILDTSVITGVPQHRERIYIVCLKDKAVFDAFSLDFPTVQKAPVTTMLLADSAVPTKYYYTSTSSTWPLVSEAVTKKGVIYQYRRVYVRENKSNECPTLTANMGSGGHNVPIILDDKGIRKLTPRECFNFQGFPADYVLPALADSHLYKLAGNAVSVPVVQLIANRLVPLL
jgi:DNA (cytosine-5)-methyltransferase 1